MITKFSNIFILLALHWISHLPATLAWCPFIGQLAMEKLSRWSTDQRCRSYSFLHDKWHFYYAIYLVRFFLDSRVDINALDGNGCTPVVTATQYNQVNAVAFFIKVIFSKAFTTYFFRIRLWSTSITINKLLQFLCDQSGADMTLRDNNGDSALHWAAYKVP